ncbi:hypothetical protein Droror1_Dr00014572 [Drosera rotundifolia]
MFLFISNSSLSFVDTPLWALAPIGLFCFSLIVHIPSIRSIVQHHLSARSSVSDDHDHDDDQVVWSIGSEPKPVKTGLSGSWVQVYNNGDVYEGEFVNGKCSGSGVYCYYLSSGRYEGDWVDGKYDGYGIETWSKGSRYKGQYKEGLRHGFGVYKAHAGDVYVGEWCNGKCHGFGVYSCCDGSVYVGQFKWGVKHGLGHFTYRNGDVYAGEYFADKMNGFGVYKYANGNLYEGSWHEGGRQGRGVYTFSTGASPSAERENRVVTSPNLETIAPSSPHAVDANKTFNVVKEARRAAEKAYNLASTDDNVKKAVGEATKAANAARVAAVKAVQKAKFSRT